MRAPVPDPASPRARTIRHVLRDLRVDQPGVAMARAVCSEGVRDFNRFWRARNLSLSKTDSTNYSGLIGYTLAAVAISWCTYSASAIFVAVLQLTEMRALVAYPVGLFCKYCCFEYD